MKPRRRPLLVEPHLFDADPSTPDCCRVRVGDRVCGLPEVNRHHQDVPPPRPAPVVDERQLRLDIDG